MPTCITLACKVLDDNDDVDDDDDNLEDRELRAYCDGQWGDDVVPYVSGGLPASFVDLEEEPLMIGGKSIFALPVGGGAPAFFFDSEEEPMFIGGRSVFAEHMRWWSTFFLPLSRAHATTVISLGFTRP